MTIVSLIGDDEIMRAEHQLVESSGILIERPEWIVPGMVIASHYKQEHKDDENGSPVMVRYVQRYSQGSRFNKNPVLIDPVTVEFEVAVNDGRYVICGAAEAYEEANTVIHTEGLGRMFVVSPDSDLAKLVCNLEERMRQKGVELASKDSDETKRYNAVKTVSDALQTTQPLFGGIIARASEAYKAYGTVLEELHKVRK